MASSSGLHDNYSHDPWCGTSLFEQPQYDLGKHPSIQHPTFPRQDTSPLIPPTFGSDRSHTDNSAPSGSESDDNRNSCSLSEIRNHRDGNLRTYDDSTITGRVDGHKTAKSGWSSAMPGYVSTMPSSYDIQLMGHATTCYGPYHNPTIDEHQAMDLSSNGYSDIGCHSQLDRTRGFDEIPFMDPVLAQDLSSDGFHNPSGIAASHTSFEPHLLPSDHNLSVDGPMHPAILIPSAYPYCDVSMPMPNRRRAVMPTNATLWSSSRMDYCATDIVTHSNILAAISSVEALEVMMQSDFGRSRYNNNSGMAGPQLSPPNLAASPGKGGNNTSQSVEDLAQAFNHTLSSRRLFKEVLPSLASADILKANPPQAIDSCGHSDIPDAVRAMRCLQNAILSGARPPLSDRVLNISWREGSRVTKKKNYQSNMQKHAHMRHTMSAPPTRERCSRQFKTHDLLKRHLKLVGEEQHDVLLESERAYIARKMIGEMARWRLKYSKTVATP